MPRAERRTGALSSTQLCTVLAVLLLLLAACERKPSGPRELAFPTFAARAAFPELTRVEDEAPAGTPGTDRAPASAFEEALRAGSTEPSTGQTEAPRRNPGQTIPLGANLAAALPGGPSSWRWSTEGHATLAVHGTGPGRPDALIYTESFLEEVGEHPSHELRRFQLTVNPEGRGTGIFGQILGTREALLRETATRGRGLGFRPGARERSTALRWIGHNDHGVILRFARHGGSWQGQRPLPKGVRPEVGGSRGDSLNGQPPAKSLDRVSAYLLIGSALEPDGVLGTHLAILCARAPRCPVAEDLAALLDSVRVESPDRLRRLREDYQTDFTDLAGDAGLEVLTPGPNDASRESSPTELAP